MTPENTQSFQSAIDAIMEDSETLKQLSNNSGFAEIWSLIHKNNKFKKLSIKEKCMCCLALGMTINAVVERE